MVTRRIPIWFILTVVLALFAIGGSVSARSYTADPPAPQSPEAVAVTPLLQYQGRLTNPTTGQPVSDGAYTMIFSLYDVATGGTALWKETKNVPVAGGLFSTALGDTTSLPQSLFSGQSLWLGIIVGSDLEATPRQAVLPVAYALSLVPGASITGNLASPALRVSNTSGPGLYVSGPTTLSGDVTIAGNLSGGTHPHSGADITSGTVAATYIDAAIARDSEITPTVLANDGAGSGLDADLLDGSHASVFALASHPHSGADITSGTVADARIDPVIARDSEIMPTVLANDGVGSGLDADRLDGLQASSFAAVTHTHSGVQYFTVGSEGFVPGSNIDYFNTYGTGGAYIASGSGALVAPVHLPNGAVVTGFRVYYFDASAGDLSVTLYGQGFSSSYFTLANVSSSGVVSYSNGIDTTITNGTIDNTSSSYLVNANSAAWDSNLKIKAAVIVYTVNTVP